MLKRYIAARRGFEPLGQEKHRHPARGVKRDAPFLKRTTPLRTSTFVVKTKDLERGSSLQRGEDGVSSQDKATNRWQRTVMLP